MRSRISRHFLALGVALGLLTSCSTTGGNAAASRVEGEPGTASRRGPGQSIVASAPPGLSLRDLGRPFTADFRRYQGADGQTLFPKAGSPLRTAQHAFEHDVDVIDTEEELAANAGAWGIGASISEGRSNRYASLRVLEIDHVYEIDDTTAMKRAPRGAVYYPWRIYMGRRYEVILQGSSERFHAGVRANLLAFSGNIDDFAEEHELKHTVQARGLAPRNDRAIFSRTPSEIRTHYRSTIDEPVPILVEWRQIPGRDVRVRPIEWSELPKDCAGEPGCEPCTRWSFHRLEATISSRKRDGRVWDADESAPDVVLSLRAMGDSRTSSKTVGYSRSWKLEPPVLVGPDDTIQLRAIDKDLIADDPIFAFHAKPGPTLAGGRLEFGSGSAVAFGTCVGAG